MEVLLENLTTWELILRLDAEGWTWKKLANKKKAGPLSYSIGDPKIWYSSCVSTSEFYLRALLSAPRLAEAGPHAILHGQLPSYYKRLLGGGKQPPPPRRRAALKFEFESDVADGIRGPLPPEDVLPGPPGPPLEAPLGGPPDAEVDPDDAVFREGWGAAFSV